LVAALVAVAGATSVVVSATDAGGTVCRRVAGVMHTEAPTWCLSDIRAAFARFETAIAMQRQPLNRKTAEAFETAAEQLTRSGDAQKKAALAKYAKGDAKSALDDLEALAGRQGEARVAEAQAWRQLGALAFATDPQRAKGAYARALLLTPEDAEVRSQLQLFFSEGIVDDAEADRQARQMLALGQFALDHGDSSAACRNWFGALVVFTPNDVPEAVQVKRRIDLANCDKPPPVTGIMDAEAGARRLFLAGDYAAAATAGRMNVMAAEVALVHWLVDNSALADALGESSRYSLFVRDFGAAETSARRALDLDKNQTWIASNLAHALLFQGKFAEADAIYDAHRGEVLANAGNKPWETAIADDFGALRNAGLDHPHMDEVIARFKKGAPPKEAPSVAGGKR
jgi:tetratricopeptide (TPR) repeat protein